LEEPFVISTRHIREDWQYPKYNIPHEGNFATDKFIV